MKKGEVNEVIGKLAERYAKKQTKKIPDKLTTEILEYARANGLIIHPFGFQYYAESFLQFGHCACDADRAKCPCPEAVAECQEQGHCLCRLYWRDLETFMIKSNWR